MPVATVLGSVSSACAGIAQADGPGDFTLNNEQPRTCNYNALTTVQIPVGAGILGHGASTAVGQSCTQSGPNFGK
jgi:hypothetical protein